MDYNLDNISDMKRDLDWLNYNTHSLDSITSFNDDCSYLKPYKMNALIKKDSSDIIKKIELYNSKKSNEPNLHLGVISSGAHTLDFKKYYGFKIDDTWNFKPVMFVYECPGNNLDSSFLTKHGTSLNNNYIRNKDIITKEKKDLLLCNRIWHADYGKMHYKNNKEMYGNNNFLFFDKQRKYSEFLLSLVLEFKLVNLYTTNFFRYELFRFQKNKKNRYVEKALNISDIYGLKTSGSEKCLFTKAPSVFIKELQIFKPHLIISTESTAYYIEQEYKNKQNKLEDDMHIVTVPHPAHYSLKNKKRFVSNVFNILSGFSVKEIIKKETINDKMYKALNKYKDIQ